MLSIQDKLISKDLKERPYDKPPIACRNILFWSTSKEVPPEQPLQVEEQEEEAHFAEYLCSFGGSIMSPETAKGGPANPLHGICMESKWQWGNVPVGESGQETQVQAHYSYFEVPIPDQLFRKCECRTFRIKASVVFGDRAAGLPMIHAVSEAVLVKMEQLTKEKHLPKGESRR